MKSKRHPRMKLLLLRNQLRLQYKRNIITLVLNNESNFPQNLSDMIISISTKRHVVVTFLAIHSDGLVSLVLERWQELMAGSPIYRNTRGGDGTNCPYYNSTLPRNHSFHARQLLYPHSQSGEVVDRGTTPRADELQDIQKHAQASQHKRDPSTVWITKINNCLALKWQMTWMP